MNRQRGKVESAVVSRQYARGDARGRYGCEGWTAGELCGKVSGASCESDSVLLCSVLLCCICVSGYRFCRSSAHVSRLVMMPHEYTLSSHALGVYTGVALAGRVSDEVGRQPVRLARHQHRPRCQEIQRG